MRRERVLLLIHKQEREKMLYLCIPWYHLLKDIIRGQRKENKLKRSFGSVVQRWPTAPDEDRLEQGKIENMDKNELLIKVVERYLFHKNYATDNPFVAEMAQKMCDLELHEMWMLTQ